MKEIIFEKQTIEYYNYYDIQDFLKKESGLAGDAITVQLLGDVNNDSFYHIDIDDKIDIYEWDVALVEALQKLKNILGNEIAVQISW